MDKPTDADPSCVLPRLSSSDLRPAPSKPRKKNSSRMVSSLHSQPVSEMDDSLLQNERLAYGMALGVGLDAEVWTINKCQIGGIAKAVSPEGDVIICDVSMRAAATDKHGQESEFMDYVCLRKEDIVDMVIRNVRLTEASAPAPASVSLQSEPAALVPDQVAGFTFHDEATVVSTDDPSSVDSLLSVAVDIPAEDFDGKKENVSQSAPNPLERVGNFTGTTESHKFASTRSHRRMPFRSETLTNGEHHGEGTAIKRNVTTGHPWPGHSGRDTRATQRRNPLGQQESNSFFYAERRGFNGNHRQWRKENTSLPVRHTKPDQLRSNDRSTGASWQPSDAVVESPSQAIIVLSLKTESTDQNLSQPKDGGIFGKKLESTSATNKSDSSAGNHLQDAFKQVDVSVVPANPWGNKNVWHRRQNHSSDSRCQAKSSSVQMVSLNPYAKEFIPTAIPSTFVDPTAPMKTVTNVSNVRKSTHDKTSFAISEPADWPLLGTGSEQSIHFVKGAGDNMETEVGSGRERWSTGNVVEEDRSHVDSARSACQWAAAGDSFSTSQQENGKWPHESAPNGFMDIGTADGMMMEFSRHLLGNSIDGGASGSFRPALVIPAFVPVGDGQGFYVPVMVPPAEDYPYYSSLFGGVPFPFGPPPPPHPHPPVAVEDGLLPTSQWNHQNGGLGRTGAGCTVWSQPINIVDGNNSTIPDAPLDTFGTYQSDKGLEHRSGWSTHASVCTLFGVDGDGDGTVKKETNPNVSIGTE